MAIYRQHQATMSTPSTLWCWSHGAHRPDVMPSCAYGRGTKQHSTPPSRTTPDRHRRPSTPRSVRISETYLSRSNQPCNFLNVSGDVDASRPDECRVISTTGIAAKLCPAPARCRPRRHVANCSHAARQSSACMAWKRRLVELLASTSAKSRTVPAVPCPDSQGWHDAELGMTPPATRSRATTHGPRNPAKSTRPWLVLEHPCQVMEPLRLATFTQMYDRRSVSLAHRLATNGVEHTNVCVCLRFAMCRRRAGGWPRTLVAHLGSPNSAPSAISQNSVTGIQGRSRQYQRT